MPRVKKVIPKTDAQLKDIEKAISRCFLFSSLDEDQRKEVSHPSHCSLLATLGLGLPRGENFVTGSVYRVLRYLIYLPASSWTNRCSETLEETM